MHEKILITGTTTSIWKNLKDMIPRDVEAVEWGREQCDLSRLEAIDKKKAVIASCNRIVLAHGVLAPARFQERSPEEIQESLSINLLSYVRIIEIALEHNPGARMVVMGSESGVKGSFDVAYALSKFALHRYVEERKILHPTQQLVCLAPSIISDAGMTLRKADQDRVQKAMQDNPKGQGVTSAQVAQLVHQLLFIDSGYLTNTVIHLNGGKFARM